MKIKIKNWIKNTKYLPVIVATTVVLFSAVVFALIRQNTVVELPETGGDLATAQGKITCQKYKADGHLEKWYCSDTLKCGTSVGSCVKKDSGDDGPGVKTCNPVDGLPYTCASNLCCSHNAAGEIIDYGCGSCSGGGENPPAAAAPKGALDGVTCTGVGGWACDADNYSKALTVKFYAEDLSSSVVFKPSASNYIGEKVADYKREIGVADSCGSVAEHGFNGYKMPTDVLKKFKDAGMSNIKVHAYAVDTPTGNLSSTPLPPNEGHTTIDLNTCVFPTPTPAGPTSTPLPPTNTPTPKPTTVLGDGNYFGDGGDGKVVINKDTYIPNKKDGDYVVKQYDSLWLDSGYTLTTAERAKGLFIYVCNDAIINGTISMTARGAAANPNTGVEVVSAAGLRLPMFTDNGTKALSGADFRGAGENVKEAVSNQPMVQNGTVYTIAKYGASTGTGGRGGAGVSINTIIYNITYGIGGSGTAFSGGSGGGGSTGYYSKNISDTTNTYGSTAGAGLPFGGSGGDAGNAYCHQGCWGDGSVTAGGGAGNPGGDGGDVVEKDANNQRHETVPLGQSGASGTGGIIWLVVGGDLTINGQIQANGSKGGNATAPGGGSGGGAIRILYAGELTKTGTVTAAGGLSGSGTYKGTSGSAGSVIINKVDDGFCGGTLGPTNTPLPTNTPVVATNTPAVSITPTPIPVIDDHQILRVGAGADVYIYGVSFENGMAENNYGGAIHNKGSLDLDNVIINSNENQFNTGLNGNGGGGAIYNNGDLSLNKTVVSNNISALYGGGIFNDENGVLTIKNSRIEDNSSISGGGAIHSYKGKLTIDNTSVSGNTVSSANNASFGSALYINSDLETNIVNSTFANNPSENGVIVADGNDINMSFVTIYEDDDKNGHIRTTQAGSINIKSSVLDGVECADNVISQGYNIFGDDTCTRIDTDFKANNPSDFGLSNFGIRAGAFTRSFEVAATAASVGYSDDCSSIGSPDYNLGKDQLFNNRPNVTFDCDSGAIEYGYYLEPTITPTPFDIDIQCGNWCMTDEDCAGFPGYTCDEVLFDAPYHNKCKIVEETCTDVGKFVTVDSCGCSDVVVITPTVTPTPALPGHNIACGEWCQADADCIGSPDTHSCDEVSDGSPYYNTCQLAETQCTEQGQVWDADKCGCVDDVLPSSPQGNHDSMSCYITEGWACDEDDYTQPLDIEIYMQYPKGLGSPIATGTANILRPDLVDENLCGGNGYHGFSIALPVGAMSFPSREHFYAYALNIGANGEDVLLNDSPIYFDKTGCTFNTTITPTPEVEDKDLELTSIELVTVPVDDYTYQIDIVATITNIGVADITESFWVYGFYDTAFVDGDSQDDGVHKYYVSTDLVSGASTEVRIAGFDLTDLIDAVHTVEFSADHFDQIIESDETNNKLEYQNVIGGLGSGAGETVVGIDLTDDAYTLNDLTSTYNVEYIGDLANGPFYAIECVDDVCSNPPMQPNWTYDDTCGCLIADNWNPEDTKISFYEGPAYLVDTAAETNGWITNEIGFIKEELVVPSQRILEIADGANVTISGVRLSNGYADDGLGGGAIYNLGNLTIINSILSGNESPTNGGAIYNGGMMQITAESKLLSNVADNGGAIYNKFVVEVVTDLNLEISDTLFQDNRANQAAVIFNNGNVSITDTTIVNNASLSTGDGLFAIVTEGGGSNMMIDSSVVKDHFSLGAIKVVGSTSIVNSTFTGNKVSVVREEESDIGQINIMYSTLNNESASNYDIVVNGGDINLVNNIIGYCSVTGGNINSWGYNVSMDQDCLDLINDTDVLTADFGLDGFTGQVFPLLGTSVAINIIPVDLCIITSDQVGTLRPQGGMCDAGAYEFMVDVTSTPIIDTPTPGVPTDTPVVTPTPIIGPYVCGDNISDDFNDGVIGSNLWVSVENGGSTNVEQDGVLTFNIPSNQILPTWTHVHTVDKLSGPFDMEVEFISLQGSNTGTVELSFTDYQNDQARVSLVNRANGNLFIVGAITNDWPNNNPVSWLEIDIPDDSTNIMARIVRVGSQIALYYKLDGGSYELILTEVNQFEDDGYMEIFSFSYGNDYPEVTAEIDNFSVICPQAILPTLTPTPVGPTSTPVPPTSTPVVPTNTAVPVATNTPYPVQPTHTPYPNQPTNTPYPVQPTSTPRPGYPTNTPVPGYPTSTPLPGEPTITPTPGDGTIVPTDEFYVTPTPYGFDVTPTSDGDLDGDGIPDEEDVDVDGDGINDNGTDSDGDGINDEHDTDDGDTAGWNLSQFIDDVISGAGNARLYAGLCCGALILLIFAIAIMLGSRKKDNSIFKDSL